MNRQRFAEHGLVQVFFDALVRQAVLEGYVSDQHFRVDGTLIRSWASLKSLRPKAASPPPEPPDTSIVAALAAGSFAATKELTLRIGEQEFTALHQQGENSQLFMVAVCEDAVLVTVFGNQTTLGLVRFYSGRAVKQIGLVLDEARSHHYVPPVFSTRDLAATKLFGD